MPDTTAASSPSNVGRRLPVLGLFVVVLEAWTFHAERYVAKGTLLCRVPPDAIDITYPASFLRELASTTGNGNCDRNMLFVELQTRGRVYQTGP